MGILASVHWPVESRHSHKGAKQEEIEVFQEQLSGNLLEGTVFPWILDVWFKATHKNLHSYY